MEVYRFNLVLIILKSIFQMGSDLCCKKVNNTSPHVFFLQAQRKEVFLQERYGHYSLTDPFLALQRDFECGVPGGDKEQRPLGSSPISVLEAVMAHCRKMQERMSAQLAAAESRQKRVRHQGVGEDFY